MTQEELLALTPQKYLEHGFRRSDGTPHPELKGDWATASVVQLRSKEVRSRELALVLAKVAALIHADQAEIIKHVRALESTLRPDVSAEAWLAACLSQCTSTADVAPLIDHVSQVLRVLSLSEATNTR